MAKKTKELPVGNDVQSLIDSVLGKTNRIYIPSGTPTWKLPTGVPSLDLLLKGGLPSGSITQIYGPEHSGKTSLAYRITGEAVKRGYSTMLLPVEGYSVSFANICGVDTNAPNYHVVTGDFSEILFNMCIEGVSQYNAKVIVLDSIAALTPKADLEKKQKEDEEDAGANVGSRARSIGTFIRQLKNPLVREGAIFVTVNRLTANITSFGGGDIAAGGKNLQYDSDIKINMRGYRLDKTSNIIKSDVSIVKGKVDEIKEYGATVLYCSHGVGIDVCRDIITVCEDKKIVTKSGSWYNYGDLKIQGAEEFANRLRSDNVLYQDLMNKIVSEGRADD